MRQSSKSRSRAFFTPTRICDGGLLSCGRRFGFQRERDRQVAVRVSVPADRRSPVLPWRMTVPELISPDASTTRARGWSNQFHHYRRDFRDGLVHFRRCRGAAQENAPLWRLRDKGHPPLAPAQTVTCASEDRTGGRSPEIQQHRGWRPTCRGRLDGFRHRIRQPRCALRRDRTFQFWKDGLHHGATAQPLGAQSSSRLRTDGRWPRQSVLS
jgi:hypothetical protein